MVIYLERVADLHMVQLMPLSLASVKSRLVLPFFYRLTRVVPDKEPLNVCVCVCPCPTVKFGYSGLSYNRYSIIRHFFWSQLIISVGDDTVIKDSVRMDLHLVQTRGPIYKICYDYLMIMPKLRSTHDGRLIYKTSYEGHKAFLRYDSLAVL